MTHVIDGTEYLDAQEFRIWRAVRDLNTLGRSTNNSQVASRSRISRTTATRVAEHLAARGFLTDAGKGNTRNWRTTDKTPPEWVFDRTAGCEIVLGVMGYYARCTSCTYVSETTSSSGLAWNWAEAHDQDQPDDHRAS